MKPTLLTLTALVPLMALFLVATGTPPVNVLLGAWHLRWVVVAGVGIWVAAHVPVTEIRVGGRR